MSPAPDAPVELSFGQAYERLQEVATELSADAAMPPERLIALLREGKGLERALRDHLDRIEQEVRAIDEGEGATPFRIVDGAGPAASGALAAPAAPAASAASAAPAAPTAARAAAPAPTPARPAEGRSGAPRDDAPPEATPPAPDPGPPAAPTLGFPGADDDIPF